MSVDEVDGTSHQSKEHTATILFCDGASLIRYEWEGEVVTLCEAGMLFGASRVHAKDKAICMLKVRPVVTKGTELSGTDGRIVARIEDKRHPALAALFGEREGGVIAKQTGKIGCQRTNGYQLRICGHDIGFQSCGSRNLVFVLRESERVSLKQCRWNSGKAVIQECLFYPMIRRWGAVALTQRSQLRSLFSDRSFPHSAILITNE